MTTTTVSVTDPATDPVLSHRDRAILAAVAAGRCSDAPAGAGLLVDGRPCSDQFARARLTAAGLLSAAGTALAVTADAAALLPG